MDKEYKMRYLVNIVLLSIATFCLQVDGLRRKIKTQKCRYTFVVNEMDMSNCPSTLPQLQADRDTLPTTYNRPYNLQSHTNSSSEVKSWLDNIEKQLYDELRKSNEINSTLTKHELSLGRAQKLLSSYESNFTAIFRMLSYLEQTMQEQSDLSQHLDKKLSHVMLDVVEVNNVLSKKVAVKDGHVQDKDIRVKSASKINACPETQEAVTFRGRLT